MALFKVTVKQRTIRKGQRLEVGMSAEVPHMGHVLPFTPDVVKEIQRQFKVKYNVDLAPISVNHWLLNVEEL